MRRDKKVVVMGLGYIGLPTATMFAVSGYEVLGVDVKEDVVETINEGQIHIEEPGLAEMVKGAVMEGNLRAARQPEPAEIFIIAVPTPLSKGKKANLDYVRNASRSIVPYLSEGNLVIVESTIPPRTTEDIILPELEESELEAGEEFFVAHCPERVLPGQIIHELAHNNRVIGGINEVSALKARKVYDSFVQGKMFITDATTAELVKLMENTYRDVNIALANELAKIAEGVKVDIWEAVELANKHPRVNVHYPGPGVGGHCLAVDPWFIIEKAGDRAQLIRKSRMINNSMPGFVVRNVKEKLFGVREPKIAVFGITYKGNVDDTRESPVLDIIDILEKEKVEISIHDPHVEEFGRELEGVDSALEDADCILIGADHKEFKELSPELAAELMETKIIFDTKNIIERQKWERAGFEVYKIGDYSNYDWQKKYGINEFEESYQEIASSEE
ncbi:MAG: nucleotide sugar dehydrogenase [Halanaerobiales bacterium]